MFLKTGDGASWAWKADNSSRFRGEPGGGQGFRQGKQRAFLDGKSESSNIQRGGQDTAGTGDTQSWRWKVERGISWTKLAQMFSATPQLPRACRHLWLVLVCRPPAPSLQEGSAGARTKSG